MGKTTIVDIAKTTGFSKSTVSLALTGRGNLKKSTINKIKKAAKKLNYYPNEIARSLVSSRSSNYIGVIVSDIRNQSYIEFVNGFENAIKDYSYHIILCSTGYDKTEEQRHIEILIRNRASGIVFCAPEKDDENIKILIKENIPFVALGSEVDGMDINIVSVDNYGGARMAMEYLISKGHTDIAHFTGPKNFGVTSERIRAYKDVLLENDLKVDDKKIIQTNGSNKSSYIMGKKLKNLKTMPTAIFAFCDYAAMGVWKYLIEKGYRVPEDVSLIGFDDIEMSGFKKVDLTTIRQPFVKIGKKTAEILLRRINHENLTNGGEKIYLTPKLIERSTVRNLN